MQTARQAASSPECLQACSPHKVPQTLDFARTCNNFVFLCLSETSDHADSGDTVRAKVYKPRRSSKHLR